MTTFAETLNRIALQTSVKTPASWVSATDDEHVELRDVFLAQTVDDILDRCDLPAPIGAQYTLTGDGSETYDLPSAFRRMKRGPWAVYETGLLYPCTPVADEGEYEFIKDRGLAGAERYYVITGLEGDYDISIYREPSASQSFLISYMTGYWLKDSSGAYATTATADNDTMLLPLDLVEQGVLYRYRQRHGLDFSANQIMYETKMSRFASDKTGRRSIRFGGQTPRKPWDVPVPDYIPDS